MNRSKRLLCIVPAAIALSLCLTVGVSALPGSEETIAADVLRQRETDGLPTADSAAASSGSETQHIKLAAHAADIALLTAEDGQETMIPVPVQADLTGAALGTGSLDTDGAPLSLRSGPGTGYDKLASIPADAVLTLTGLEDGWYKTSYNGIEGYVCGDYIKPDTAAEKNNQPTQTEQPEQNDQPAQAEQPEQNDRPTQTEQPEQNDRPAQTEQPAQNDQPAQDEQPAQSYDGPSIGLLDIGGSTLTLRSGPGTEHSKLASIPADAVLLLTGLENGWYKTAYNGIEGYVSADYVKASSKLDADLGTGTPDTDGTTLSLRSGPGTGYEKLANIPASATLDLTGFENGWFKTSYNGIEGYVSGDYIKLSKAYEPAPAPSLPTPTPVAPAPTPVEPTPAEPDPTPAEPTPDEPEPAPSDSSLADQVIAYAKQFLGKPYIYATAGPNSFDCSGFTSFVFGHFGYSLNRSAADQYSNGTPVDQSQMQPGDLLLWRAYGSSSLATHVGIYIGNNQYIHASSSFGKVVINDMNYAISTRYLVGVRRILN